MKYFSLSVMSVPSFHFIVLMSTSFILLFPLYIPAVHVMLLLAISTQFSLSHSPFTYLHLFLMFVFMGLSQWTSLNVIESYGNQWYKRKGLTFSFSLIGCCRYKKLSSLLLRMTHWERRRLNFTKLRGDTHTLYH